MSKKVLIVEDEEILSDQMAKALNAQGYESHTASNGEEGLKAIDEIQPAIVLMDIMMPKMDGIEMLKEVQKNEEYKKIPFIVLTNADDLETVSKIFENGGYDYYIKAETPLQMIIDNVKNKIGE